MPTESIRNLTKRTLRLLFWVPAFAGMTESIPSHHRLRDSRYPAAPKATDTLSDSLIPRIGR